MNNKDKKDVNSIEREVEDATEYGEFVSSFFEWMTPEEQKKRAKHLEDIENKKK